MEDALVGDSSKIIAKNWSFTEVFSNIIPEVRLASSFSRKIGKISFKIVFGIYFEAESTA